MMKAVLLFGASVAFGQTTNCFTQSTDNCTTAGMNCVLTTPRCYRKLPMQNVTACDTSSMTTCAGTQCAASTSVSDLQSCSKCADTCGALTTNATCTDPNGATCAWAPAQCFPGPTPSPAFPCSGTDSGKCTAESGCFWFSFSQTACGASTTYSNCIQCNSTVATLAVRSALKNNIGKKCSYTVVAPFTQATSYSILAAAQNSDVTMCPAFTAPSMIDTPLVTTTALLGGLGIFGVTPSFAATATATCADTSSAASLIPSLAIMGVIVAFIA